MEQIKIREIKPQDINEFSRIMRKFYKYAGNEQTSENELKKLFEKALNKIQNYTIIGAFQDKKMIGLISMTFAESSYKISPFCWCDDFFIEDRFRGKSIGKKLIEEVRKMAIKKNCSNILVGVGEDEENAKKFYKKIGFLDMKCKLLTLPLSFKTPV